MRYYISFFLIICILSVFFVGCEDNSTDTDTQPPETTPVADTTTVAPTLPDSTVPDTTTIAPETTAVPDTTVLDTTEPVTTAPIPAETTEPWVVTSPAGDGWSGFH